MFGSKSGMTDNRDKRRHQSLSACHAYCTLHRHWNTNIPRTRCLLLVEDNTLGRLRVFNISSQVQTSFYQNQFELGGNNSRFSDSDQRGRGALTVTSNQQRTGQRSSDWDANIIRISILYFVPHSSARPRIITQR